MSTRNLAVMAGVIVIGLITFGVVMLSTSNGDYTAATPKPSATKAATNNGSSKLEKTDITVGTGDEAVAGKKVSVNYRGTLNDGTEFDSSYKRNQPFEFSLGAGQVIKGWDEGVVGMKVGGKRKLVIPPELGYGSQANGSIPANSTLTFEIELLAVN